MVRFAVTGPFRVLALSKTAMALPAELAAKSRAFVESRKIADTVNVRPRLRAGAIFPVAVAAELKTGMSMSSATQSRFRPLASGTSVGAAILALDDSTGR